MILKILAWVAVIISLGWANSVESRIDLGRARTEAAKTDAIVLQNYAQQTQVSLNRLEAKLERITLQLDQVESRLNLMQRLKQGEPR